MQGKVGKVSYVMIEKAHKITCSMCWNYIMA
jgi:hypothetical protein